MARIKASDYIADFLFKQGVKQVYEVVGGMITHLVDSIHQGGNVELVSVHHEQGAAFAADAAGRMTGIPGVAMATSGPGATNLLTGIGSCYFDSSPAVFITGQVNRSEQRGSLQVRQLGFQETDIVSMAKPITKAAWQINDPEQLPRMMHEAFELAVSDRPGPVLVDIPMDVQRAAVEASYVHPKLEQQRSNDFNPLIQPMLSVLAAAARPLILVGGGLRSARVRDMFQSVAEALNVPVVNSLMAVDALPTGHPLRLGLIGSYGNRWANLAIGRADLIVVIGSRLDVRQTGAMAEAFKGNRTIYHLDCDVAEVNNRVRGCVPILGHLKELFPAILKSLSHSRKSQRAAWLDELAQLRAQWPDIKELETTPGINPNRFMHDLSAASKSAQTFVADVGQHQMWAAQSLDLMHGQNFITSGGMGAMGFALPAGIGASLAVDRKPVVVIAGDGGFQLNLQELQTIKRNGLPLKMVILNNQCHGMVRQFQESYFEARYQSTLWGYSAPDFSRLAQAYGIAAATVSKSDEVSAALQQMWQSPDSPYLLQVMIDPFANAYPKIAFGHPITEMEPFIKPLDMEST